MYCEQVTCISRKKTCAYTQIIIHMYKYNGICTHTHTLTKNISYERVPQGPSSLRKAHQHLLAKEFPEKEHIQFYYVIWYHVPLHHISTYWIYILNKYISQYSIFNQLITITAMASCFLKLDVVNFNQFSPGQTWKKLVLSMTSTTIKSEETNPETFS